METKGRGERNLGTRLGHRVLIVAVPPRGRPPWSSPRSRTSPRAPEVSWKRELRFHLPPCTAETRRLPGVPITLLQEILRRIETNLLFLLFFFWKRERILF